MIEKPKILIAVLIYNTENKINQLAGEIKTFLGGYIADQEHSFYLSLIVFDDASRDKSLEKLTIALNGICEIRSATKNQGYGGSVKCAFEYARESGYDYLCIFPGDLQRVFADTRRLIEAALSGGYDVVTGSKDPSLIMGKMPLRRKYGNILIKHLTRLWGEKVTDPLAGFKCYKIFPCYKLVWLCQSRFGFDLDFSFWSVYLGLKKGEVPSTASYESHTSTIRSTTLQGIRFVFRALLLAVVVKPALRTLRYSSTKK